MNKEYPPISVIIIGLNVQKVLRDCINSVLNTDYPVSLLEIIYVDGGSNDESVLIAESFEDLKIIELKDPHPTPGKGRNAGYKAASHNVIQFMDADTVLKPDWLKTAIPYLKEKNAAVTGKIIEKYPGKNRYHLLGDIEWNISGGRDGWAFSEGPCKTFGGIVLILKDALEEVDGYDDSLVAGEDPDISYRIRQAGWVIYRLNTDMVTHDINMNTFRQYFKRSFRSGHAYAEISLRYIKNEEKYFARQFFRIILGAILPIIMLLFFSIINLPVPGVILALLMAFRPLIKIYLFKNRYQLNTSHALLYGLHLSFVVYPQFLGILRYLFTRVFGVPLKNRGYKPTS